MRYYTLNLLLSSYCRERCTSIRLHRPDHIQAERPRSILENTGAHCRPGLRQPERLGAFVTRVCNNVLREHYREAAKEIPTGDEVGMNVPDPAIAVADAIVYGQMQQRVRHILTQLSERNRRLLTAIFLDERDKEEVCHSLGVNRKYRRLLLWRAKRSCKALFLQETEDG